MATALKPRRQPMAIVAQVCPAESALREWARLKRQGQPVDEKRDNFTGFTPWEQAIYDVEWNAEKALATSAIGATFQLLIGAMSGDMDVLPFQQHALLSAYAHVRSGIVDADLEIAERQYFRGDRFHNLVELPERQSTLAHWLGHMHRTTSAA